MRPQKPLHAWFNPFRAWKHIENPSMHENPPQNPSTEHSNLFMHENISVRENHSLHDSNPSMHENPLMPSTLFGGFFDDRSTRFNGLRISTSPPNHKNLELEWPRISRMKSPNHSMASELVQSEPPNQKNLGLEWSRISRMKSPNQWNAVKPVGWN